MTNLVEEFLSIKYLFNSSMNEKLPIKLVVASFSILLLIFLLYMRIGDSKDLRRLKSAELYQTIETRADSVKTTVYRQSLIGKKLTSIKSLIMANDVRYEPPEFELVYYYNSIDSRDVVIVGYELLLDISVIYPEISPTVIEMALDEPIGGMHPFIEYYHDSIIVVNNDIVFKELLYTGTPVFLIINKEYEILDAFYPVLAYIESNRKQFFNYLGHINQGIKS